MTMMQWSRRRQSSWVQLAGHQGMCVTDHSHTGSQTPAIKYASNGNDDATYFYVILGLSVSSSATLENMK